MVRIYYNIISRAGEDISSWLEKANSPAPLSGLDYSSIEVPESPADRTVTDMSAVVLASDIKELLVKSDTSVKIGLVRVGRYYHLVVESSKKLSYEMAKLASWDRMEADTDHTFEEVCELVPLII